MSRARGPHSAEARRAPDVRSSITARDAVRRARGAGSSRGRGCRRPSRSRAGTGRGATRVTVRSHSMPPRRLSSWVYVIAPDRRGRRRSRTAAAARPPRPGPTISILAKRRLVEQRRRLPRRERLGADRRATSARPPSRAAGAPRARASPRPRRRVRLEPVRALPARLLAERRRRAPRAARRPARPGAAAPPGAPRSGSGCRSRSRSSRSSGPACTPGSGTAPPNRRMSIFHRSSSGSPSTIHDATWRPMPPGAGDPVGAEPGGHEEPADLATRRG